MAPFISLENVTVRLRDRWLLPETCWDIQTGQHWAVVGPNGSGKTTLARAVAGRLPVVQGRIRYHFSPQPAPTDLGYLSFELGQRLMAQEAEADQRRCFSGDIHQQTSVRQLLNAVSSGGNKDWPDPLARQLKIAHLLDRPFCSLSTGEFRQVLLGRALMGKPRLLILDEPFDGLDPAARDHLARTVSQLAQQGVQLILITHRAEELLPRISHVLKVENCRVTAQGPRKQFFLKGENPGRQVRRSGPAPPKPVSPSAPPSIVMKDIQVAYGDHQVIHGLNWMVRPGEHWAITGPNGAGKSTLLGLVAGDHPQAYANDIRLFGRKRGSGESIWEIKARISVVSAGLQMGYHKSISAFDAVLSGFFDSIGLYRQAADWQKQGASQWLRRLGLAELADCRFDRLSYGQRRMVLIGRALVKSPQILILDEPCQGLDPENRRQVLARIDHIGANTLAQLLYVTHHPAEIPACITHHLRLEPNPKGGYQGRSVPDIGFPRAL